MKKRISILICFIFCAITIGCAKPNPKQIVLRDHSESLYNYTKEPCPETYAQYKSALEKVIEDSSKYQILVPPGIYAELGFIHFQNRNYDEAKKYYALEYQTYPESSIFIMRLLTAIEAREGATDPSKD